MDSTSRPRSTAGHQIVEGACARGHGQGVAADARRGAMAAHGRAGRCRSGPATGVGVVEEALEHAVDHQRVAATGQALAVEALGPERAGSVGSSTTLSRGEAICSPRRPAKGERPLSTRSPVSVPPARPTIVAASRGSSTMVRRCDGTGRRPEEAHGPGDGVVGGTFGVEATRAAGGVDAHAHLGLVAVGGQGEDRQPAGGAAAVAGDAGAGGHRALARRVVVGGGAHALHAGVAADGGPFEGERELDLGVGRERGQAVVPDQGVEVDRLDAVGLGQAEPLVGLAEPGVVAGLGQRLDQHGLVEGAGVGEALAMVGHHPDADAEATRPRSATRPGRRRPSPGWSRPGRRRPRSARRAGRGSATRRARSTSGEQPVRHRRW